VVEAILSTLIYCFTSEIFLRGNLGIVLLSSIFLIWLVSCFTIFPYVGALVLYKDTTVEILNGVAISGIKFPRAVWSLVKWGWILPLGLAILVLFKFIFSEVFALIVWWLYDWETDRRFDGRSKPKEIKI
jgi:hypothetical protein